MSLTSAYEAFLGFPSATHLSEDASLNYITTLTTVNGSAAIAKHLSQQQKIVRKKHEKLLGTVEANTALCVDVETTLEFITGGGAYLPGLDDNFLADHVVTFPMVHIVHFDNNRQIQQIRLYWDQGSLLKLVDVIGSRARNWPIRDGKDQARLIASSTAALTAQGPLATTIEQMGGVVITSKLPSPRKNTLHDPHAGFSMPDSSEVTRESAYTGQAAARVSAKPPPRDYHDIFVGNDSDASPASKLRSQSPTKHGSGHDGAAPKGGGGKNFKPSRLFDTEESEMIGANSPQKGKKVQANKYNHFDFADGTNELKQQQQAAGLRTNVKHQPQWNLADFSTPEKLPRKIRAQDVRHFGFSEEEDKLECRISNPHVAQPRKDTESQFGLEDDDIVAAEGRSDHPPGRPVKNGSETYGNNLDEAGGDAPIQAKIAQPLGTNANLKNREDFKPHFETSDSTAGLGEKTASENNRHIPEHRSKAARMMGAQWEATDTSPSVPIQQAKRQDPTSPSKLPANDKENMGLGGKQTASTTITVAGDGMGARKGAARNELAHTTIRTGGDGMGGRKGAAPTWGLGDASDEEGNEAMHVGKFLAGKRQQAPADNSFWDF